MEVVKESLDVKKEGRDVATLDTCLDRMDHAQHGVRRCVIVAGPKLAGGKEVKMCSIKKDALQDNSL